MNGANRNWRLWDLVLALLAAAVAAGLLTESAAVAEGVRRGLATCAGVLIPSLFPFMVLSGLLSLTRLGESLSAPLSPVTKRLFRLPGELGATVLLSLVGGYPVGAKSIAELLEQKRIDSGTAERMLCFCVNSGPSFLITAVGAGMFLQKSAGVILFATQTAATLLIGVGVSLRAPLKERGEAERSYPRGAEAFVGAVTGAANAMIAMCAFAVLFSGLLSLVEAAGLPARIAAVAPVGAQTVQALIAGLFEVTSGCLNASRIGGVFSFGLVSAFVSFSGLSVIFQIMSCFRRTPIRFRAFLLSRLAHMGLSTAMAVPLYRAYCADSAVWLAQAPPVLAADSRTVAISICLVGMSTILILCSFSTKNGKYLQKKPK